jgi:hypothetical protein
MFALGDNRCALEVELTVKRLDRYTSILQSYSAERTEVGTVFYVCGTETVRDVLWRAAGESRRFYFALYRDFLENPTGALFESPHDRVALRELI